MADMRQPHGGRGRCNPRHAMMLGHPETVIAKAFGMGGKVSCLGQRGRDVAAFAHGDKVEQGKACHAHHMGA